MFSFKNFLKVLLFFFSVLIVILIVSWISYLAINKVQIKNAVESTYGVSVDKVRTMRYGAERKTRFTKTGLQKGKSATTKKAIVQVAEGDTIDFYNKL